MQSFLYIIVVLSNCLISLSAERSFVIDYVNNQFLKDGQPFRYVSGSLHYFRVPQELWSDRMYKYRAAGLNAIQTYIEWNSHEPEENEFDFSGNNDLIKFLETAQNNDLLVILRTGPLIDAERDMGGLPYWLLTKDPKMKLRTYDKSFISELDKWYSVLLPKLIPMLYKNGGPVISIQIENEYGSFGCDFEYTTYLRDLFFNYFKNDVILFTTDNDNDVALKCGKIDGVFATVDFGTDSDPSTAFATQRIHQQFGPNVNSEFYSGWLDYWEYPHSVTDSSDVCNALNKILALNASVNVYMFHGGTSFGFGSGSNVDNNTFKACPTSYDYDAPLDEAGDPTPKYYAMSEVIKKNLRLPDTPMPIPAPKMQLKPIHMIPVTNLFDLSYQLSSSSISSLYPLTFEQLKIRHGFVLYSTNISVNPSDPAVLQVNGLADRAQVFVDQQYAGTLSSTQKVFQLPINTKKKSKIDILVENQGRICSGHGVGELKGITSNVTLGPIILKNWNHIRIFPQWLEAVKAIEKRMIENKEMSAKVFNYKKRVPTVYWSQFALPEKIERYDTFLRLDGWKKGIAFLNGFNLGRYWPIAGPQLTLYTPKHLFKPFPGNKTDIINDIVIFELEGSPCDTSNECTVQFVKTHVINGTTPYTTSSKSQNIDYSKEMSFNDELYLELEQELDKFAENQIQNEALKQLNVKAPADPYIIL